RPFLRSSPTRRSSDLGFSAGKRRAGGVPRAGETGGRTGARTDARRRRILQCVGDRGGVALRAAAAEMGEGLIGLPLPKNSAILYIKFYGQAMKERSRPHAPTGRRCRD